MDYSLQVLSDTHTECIKNIEKKSYFDIWEKFVSVTGDLLILAGDIGNPMCETYWSFIDFVSRKAKYVLLITGNHEYWGNEKNLTEKFIQQKIKNFKNVKFLQRNFHIIEKTVYLGCTLWSYIPKEFSKELENWAGDFKFIKNCSNFSIYNSWHFQDLQWLIDNVCSFRQKGYQVVVITHHTPNFELNFNPDFCVNWREFNFNSNLSFLYPYVKLWIYGHTHYDYNYHHIYNIPNFSTTFISNQRGYPEKIKKKYSPNFSVKIKNIPDSPNIESPINLFFEYNDSYVKNIQSKFLQWIKNNKRV